MKKTTPFLPGFSTKLYGSRKRRQLEATRLQREKLRAQSISDLGALFSDILPVERLEAANTFGPGKRRKRVFPQAVVFWAWASQLLEFNASCNKALTLIQSWYSKAKLQAPKFNNSSYCRARMNLSDEFLDEVSGLIENYAQSLVQERWHGHRLKAIDGSSVRLMDNFENQQDYPQSSSQKPGCGFPVMGFVGVLDLGLGTLESYVVCRQNEHDANGAWRLRESFSPGDLVIADRAFCSYELMASLLQRDVQSVMRLHQGRERKLDWRRGKKLDANSRLVEWKKNAKPGKSGITPKEWQKLPDTLIVRLVRVRAKGRDGKMRNLYLATTLTDTEYPTQEIAKLYAERWKIEVKFRDIKTTMQLEEFRVKTPEMARKMMRMVQLVYNLIKVRQLEAIRGGAILIDEMAFKDTVAVLNEFRSGFRALLSHPRLLAKEWQKLEQRIAERTLRIRPGRSEPRAMKLRPKPFQYLSALRHKFNEILHRSNYRKTA